MTSHVSRFGCLLVDVRLTVTLSGFLLAEEFAKYFPSLKNFRSDADREALRSPYVSEENVNESSFVDPVHVP